MATSKDGYATSLSDTFRSFNVLKCLRSSETLESTFRSGNANCLQARVRGLTKLLSDQKIFQLVLRYHSDVALPDEMEHPSSSRLIREFFKKDVKDFDLQVEIPESESESEYERPCPFDSYGMEDWEKMLEILDKLHFHDKMANFQDFMRVSVTYSGPSRLKGGEWIAMVERRVGKMEERMSPIKISDNSWNIYLT